MGRSKGSGACGSEWEGSLEDPLVPVHLPCELPDMLGPQRRGGAGESES